MTITVLVGTTKGAFLLHGDQDRGNFTVSGPHCDGWPINHVIGDPDTGTIWAAGGGEWHGAGVWRSADNGETWTLSQLANGQSDAFAAANPELAAQLGFTPAPPAPHTGEIDTFWSLGRAGGTVYAGAKPAALFESRDDGTSWAPVRGLSDHPSRETWNPGGAGLVLHSIVSAPEDPSKLWLGISAAGIFASEDGGQSWDRRNRRSNEAAGEACTAHPAGGDAQEIGHCVHNIVRAGGDGETGDLLYQQNHHGVFRSQDGGRSWHDISDGLPSKFGFPIAVHPHDPRTIWVLPLMEMAGRYPPGANCIVWRSRDGGDSWQPMTDGLPQETCFFTVLRQAMATDRAAEAGVYFGTNSGSVFASRDAGEHWSEIARHLPTVLSVEVLDRVH
ncbi:WD40/YVTN/BNR-like repeat-containing protein [Anianabacter salinae]|uniref:WD40/YVTN/BNR-like repeat-containing protein n=1 Tax=Anianabacter salinae TaxID=2851023 RepID=UPI00225DDA8C|nr:sialidase family protein [Anianabacter salinae]MBV0911403.1 exo-alpha-sialidase [Anianabacter salinae]